MRTQVGAPDALIPLRPPLTRYKRELVVAAEEAAAAAAAAGGPPKSGPAWLPPLGSNGALW